MRQLIKIILLCSLLIFSWQVFAIDVSQPMGDWRMIDETTNHPRCIIQISLTPQQTLIGTIKKSIPLPGKAPSTICTECVGKYHNKPVAGMAIIWGFKLKGDKWTNGRILDPTTGKTYRCYLKVIENGTKLKVHGYIGIPLLGRTQIWERV